MKSLPSYKIVKFWSGNYQDAAVSYIEHGGKLYKPVHQYGIWGTKKYQDGTEPFGNLGSVINIGGNLYRMGERKAIPLSLVGDEFLMPRDWKRGLSFSTEAPELNLIVHLTNDGYPYQLIPEERG